MSTTTEKKKPKELKLSKAQKLFFDLIEAGEAPNTKTTGAAKISNRWLKVLQGLEWVTGQGKKAKYIGPYPIPRLYIKKLFIERMSKYYKEHAPEALEAARLTPTPSADDLNGEGTTPKDLLFPINSLGHRERPPRTPLSRYSEAEILAELKRLGFIEAVKEKTIKKTLGDRTEYLTKKTIIKL